MLESERENGALARFTVIAPLLAQGDPRTLAERIAELAEREWPQADGSTRKFAPSTIEGWHYGYLAKGFAGLRDQPRSDKGLSRRVTPELDEALRLLLDGHPRLRIRQAIRRLRETGDGRRQTDAGNVRPRGQPRPDHPGPLLVWPGAAAGCIARAGGTDTLGQ